LKFASPEYIAVIEWLPTASALVVSVPTPFTREPVPSGDVPSKNVIVPVGILMPELTVAVSVTAFRVITGFTLDCSETLGVALFTVRVTEPVAVL
jgi:hypothetical protein